MTQRSIWNRAWYASLRTLCRMASAPAFRLRVQGRQNAPASGAVLVMSNHQSHLDPVLVGLCFDRRLNYLARETLFRFPPLRWMIRSVDAIPLDRDGLALAGIKETLRRLKHEEMVLLFPEGTRSRDGQVGELKPGFCALARRAKVSLLPMALDGTFAAFPRSSKFPRPLPIQIHIGEPMGPEEVASLDDAQLVAEVRRRMVELHAEAKRALARANNSQIAQPAADSAAV
ncbi:MAG: 1-acyl-sn-glycerol-3-phosphate acyltransferase [Planctomycetia bacterium]|nr:1-acyl-sn-glycerol-3-phosphate acyltransferase [Planctomycetia bacterium]